MYRFSPLIIILYLRQQKHPFDENRAQRQCGHGKSSRSRTDKIDNYRQSTVSSEIGHSVGEQNTSAHNGIIGNIRHRGDIVRLQIISIIVRRAHR